MSTNFPTGLDDNTNLPHKAAQDPITSAENNTEIDAIKALETKVGVDSSAVATSLDKRVATLETATVAPTTGDYLTGTAQAGLSNEIVVGASPQGELGGTWASPTVDATHSGSTHAATQAAAESTAAGALSTHESDKTAVHGFTDTDNVARIAGELGGTGASPTVTATHSGSAHHNALTIGADGEHSLATQVLSGVDASASQVGHQKTALIPLTWSLPGTLAVAAGSLYVQVPVACTYAYTTATVGTAPTGAAILFDVHYHATVPASAVTTWTTQANRPTIAISEFRNSAVTAPEVTSFAANSVLRLDVDQVGSTIAGANGTVTVWCKVT